MEIFRITTRKWANTLSGSGFSGRWNSEGIFVVYCAESKSLACLENLVHRNGFGQNDNFCVISLFIPDDLVATEVQIQQLPIGWNDPLERGHLICRIFGDRWVAAGKTCLLRVPSAIIDGEYNVLINPLHKDFNKIVVKSVEKFTFDQRLK